MAPGTSSGDVLTVGQSASLAYGMMYTNSNLTSITYPFTVPFGSIYKPTVPSGGSATTNLESNGVLSVSVAGVYKIEASLLVQY